MPKDQNAESVMETLNYKVAIEKMILNSRKKVFLTKELILQYHALAMNGKGFAGKLRKENVFIKKNPAFATSDWKIIEKKLDELLKKYAIFENTKQDIKKIVDIATLTGAAIVALSSQYACFFSNNEKSAIFSREKGDSTAIFSPDLTFSLMYSRTFGNVLLLSV